MIETNCAYCTFAIKNNGIQTGCYFNRLDKFPKVWSSETDSWILSKYCSRFRNAIIDPDLAIKQSRVRVDCIVVANDDNDISDLIKTLQTFNPFSIIIVTYNSVDNLLQYQLPVIRVFEGDLVDEAIRKCRGNYYAVINSSCKLKDNFIDNLNDLVEEQLKPVIMIEDDQYYIINTAIHRFLGGNHSISIRSKIQKFLNAYDESNLDSL